MDIKSLVLKSQYHDSVSLMLVAKEIRNLPGILDAAVVMGTEANKDLLEQAGLITNEAKEASADDLVIVVKCETGAEAILQQAQTFLERKTSFESGSSPYENLSTRSALRAHPDANVAVISVAGAYAAREAREALAGGLHVLLFSDNVSLADEIALKKFALSRGLLLMGPGAGTAIINGVGLGFANKVPDGPVGIVSAAGTGLQEVSTILAKQGVGISQAIGTGGRDLYTEVGGLMAKAGIQALVEDESTKVIVLISKPADQSVIDQIIQLLKDGKKESVICLLGAGYVSGKDGNLNFTRTLEECAVITAALANGRTLNLAEYYASQNRKLAEQAAMIKAGLNPQQRFLRGLYSGGTLCYEAQVIWRDMLEMQVFSNAPLDEACFMDAKDTNRKHIALDLGEEEYTLGRPHPMIDNDLRSRMIRMESIDPLVAVILLDVVIGYGAHPDPAGELGAAIHEMRQTATAEKREIVFIASVTGTEDDPQKLSATTKKLEQAGVIVCSTNAQAARLAGLIVSG